MGPDNLQGSLPPKLSKSFVKQPTYTPVLLPRTLCIGTPAVVLVNAEGSHIEEIHTILQCLVCYLKHETLLTIRAIGFIGGHREKRGIEVEWILF